VLLVIVSSGATLGLWRHDQRMRAVAKQAELAFKLKDSEERLRLALSSAAQGLYDLDLLTGAVVVSPEYATMLGYDPETFVETAASWEQRLHPEDRAAASSALRDYLEGRTPAYRVEFRLQTAAGPWKWVLSVGQVVARDVDGRPKRMLGTHTDIAQLKWTQEEHARAAAQLRRLLANSPTVVYNLQIVAGQLQPVAISDNVERILGYTTAEVMQPGFWDTHVHPADRRLAEQGHGQLLTSDEASHEYRFLRSDGAYIWVLDRVSVLRRDAAGVPVELAGAWNDITLRYEAELALRSSEERLRLAMASARQGLWDLSLDTGITRTSPEYAVMLGHEPDDFEESAAAWNARVHPDDFERCQAVFRDYLEGRRPDYVVEFRQRTKSDGWIWIHSTGRIIEWTSDGRPTRLLGIHTDITLRKEAELSAARLSTLYLTLSRCNEAIVRSSSPEALFDEVCRATVDSGGFSMAWVGVVEPRTGAIQQVSAYGAQLGYLADLALTIDPDTVAGQGPFGHAIRNRAPIWFDDVEAAAIESPLMDRVRSFGWAGMAAVPLMRGGEAVGALGIYSNVRGRFDPESRQLLTEMGANISFALEAFAREARRKEAEAQLRQSEQRYRALFSESSVPMLVIDPSRSLIVDANGAASSFYGWPVAELCGQPVSQIASLPPDELRAALDLTVASSRGHFTTRHQMRDGELRDVEVFSAVITMENQRRVVAIVTDITARLQAERKAEQLSRMYLTLSRCNEAIARSESADELFPLICAAAVDAGGFDLAWIGLIDPVSLDVKSVAANGRALDYIDGLRVSAHPDSPYAAGPTGLAIRERRPVWMNDIPNDPRTTPWQERVQDYGWVAAVSIPLIREGEAVGALTIYSKTAQGFDEDTRGLLVEMAADLSFALDVLARDARRQQAEQRLRQSEARYRTLFAESGVPMLLIESSTGRIVDGNMAAAEFYGHDVAVLRRMDIRQVDTLPSPDLEARMARLIGGQRMRFTAGHRLASGEVRDVEVFTASVSVDDQPRTLAIISDVTARNQAEAALIEKEFQLTEAQRLAHIGNWTRHPDGTGYWSDEMFRLYGLPAGTTTPGPTDMDHCIHPEDLELVKRTQQAHLRGESVAEVTFRTLREDGSVRYLVERGERRTAPDGRSYAAGTLQDVTDRTNAELALLQSEERLRLALGAARQGLWDIDLVSGTAMVSPPDAASPGFADGIAALNMTQFGEMFHPEDRDRVGTAFRAYATGEAHSFDEEFRLVLPDGQVRWAQSTGGIVERDSEGRTRRVVGVVTDITERHAFLAALRLRDRAIESSQNAVAIADLEGRLTYVNRAFLEAWEMANPAEAVGRNAVEFWEEPERPAAVIREMNLQQAPWTGELRALTATGLLRDMLTSTAFVTDEQNRPIGLVGTFVDITDRKLSEQAMAASLREKEALLKEVHHRVKNNLQVISSLLRLELGRTAEPGVRLVLGEMQNRILSMALLHETLYRSDDLSRVDLSTYLNRLVQQLFRSSAPTSGRVTLQVTLAPAFVDLEQAVPCGLLVTELVSNSLKHAFPDNRSGEIHVTLSPVDGGPALRLIVADTGLGLPTDFDARRTQSLGLVLVADLARQLRGTLTIDSGPGAAFTLDFTPRGGHSAPAPSRESD